MSRNLNLYNQTALKLVAGPTIVLPAAAALWSLPHTLLYLGIAGGGLAHVNSKTNGKGPEAWVDPEVIESVWTDVKQFSEKRIADVRGMEVILKDGPEKLPGKLLGAFGSGPELIGKVQKGMANMKAGGNPTPSDAASSVPTKE